MRTAATIRQPVTAQPRRKTLDWRDEPLLPSDIEAMREGDRAMAEGRLIPHAQVMAELAEIRRQHGGSK